MLKRSPLFFFFLIFIIRKYRPFVAILFVPRHETIFPVYGLELDNHIFFISNLHTHTPDRS